MSTFRMRKVQITGSTDGEHVVTEGPLASLCNTMGGRGPDCAPYWANYNRFNDVSLWSALMAKAYPLPRGVEVVWAQMAPHLVNKDGTRWLGDQQSKDALRVPLTFVDESQEKACGQISIHFMPEERKQ